MPPPARERANIGGRLLVPALISVDWGTSSLRVYLLAADGAVVDRREAAQGILAVEGGRFAAALAAACRPWLDAHGPLPAILSGMIGSRQGWIEAPYLPCPAGLDDLAGRLVVLPVEGFGAVRLAPGVVTRADGVPDVMRGEECQIVGALADLARADGRFVLPGTHSKHATVAGGRITGFRTFLTGEAFAALRHHTILGRLMADRDAGEEDAGDGSGFDRGVDDARGRPLLHAVFGARTLRLMDELPLREAADYLSGLLIATELADLPPGDPVVLIGGADLVARYRRAAARIGIATLAAPADCVRVGHLALARRAGILAA